MTTFTMAGELHPIGARTSNSGYLCTKISNSTKYGLKHIDKIWANSLNTLKRKFNESDR